MSDANNLTIPEAHLHFAKKANGEVWKLLQIDQRTRDEDERMLAAAFASYYHWLLAGNTVHRQRGEYLIARVYLALGKTAEALDHANRCLELTNENPDQMEDFDRAFAYEMAARTQAASGERALAMTYREKAREIGASIQDAEDFEIFFGDFESGNWYGLT